MLSLSGLRSAFCLLCCVGFLFVSFVLQIKILVVVCFVFISVALAAFLSVSSRGLFDVDVVLLVVFVHCSDSYTQTASRRIAWRIVLMVTTQAVFAVSTCWPLYLSFIYEVCFVLFLFCIHCCVVMCVTQTKAKERLEAVQKITHLDQLLLLAEGFEAFLEFASTEFCRFCFFFPPYLCCCVRIHVCAVRMCCFGNVCKIFAS